MSISAPHQDIVGVGEIYTWEKDKYLRYIRCNDNYAMAAGLDSPYSIIGMTDDQMPWRSLADVFRTGDNRVIYDGNPRILVQEKEIMADRSADILVTEKQLLKRSGECIGVTGNFLDITGYYLERKSAAVFDEATKKLRLPAEFGDTYLTRAEAAVLERVVNGLTCERIADELGNSKRTIEQHVSSLKQKLQCSTKADLITTTQRHGLHVTLFEIKSKLERRQR